jgi:tripartite-type tricarboxylate transporter receptor subunit TctC
MPARCPLFAARYSLVAFALVAAATTALAQGWPQRPVKVLVPFAAGGNIDVMGRLAASRLSEAFGQQFVVENRVGGNGVIATEAVARAPADGNTLLWASTSVIAIFPAISKVGYDPVKDLAPVSLFGVAPQVLIVNPKIPAQNVPEFVAYVKAQKDKLAYAGGGGPGSASNLVMALFLKRAGVEMAHVAYRGNAPALADVVAGHVPTMFSNLSDALPHAESGAIRLLAVSSEKRAAQIPHVPTVSESGYPGYNMITWNGLMAPAGTPRTIVNRIADEIAGAVKETKFAERLVAYGVDPLGNRPDEFAAMITADIAQWSEAVRNAGIKLQ